MLVETLFLKIKIITINDTEAPVFTSIPESLEFDCTDVLPTEMATAEDACKQWSKQLLLLMQWIQNVQTHT